MSIELTPEANALLRFHGAAQVDEALKDGVRNLVVYGKKAQVTAAVQRAAQGEGALAQLLGGSAQDYELLSLILEECSASRDSCSSRETTLAPGSAGAGLRRVCFVLAPTACSRHNAPSRPHALASALRSCSGRGAVTVFLCLEEKAHFLALGAAVARAFPTWSAMPAAKKRLCERSIDAVFDADLAEDELTMVSQVGHSIRLAARLVDAPCNILHTDSYLEIARSVVAEVAAGAQGSASMAVIRGEELAERGFGGIYGVGKAAVHPPALAVLSFLPSGCDPEGTSTCLVGKGIVYDTGGLSIKGKTTMPGMKKDMGGSAGLLGAWRACCLSGLPRKPIHAFLCLAENSVAAVATRPDDIHTLSSGKTVEINNTDAEGRLVLSDGVSYAARSFNPHVIIDMATLTGAQGVTTGLRHAAIYCNDEDLEAAAVRAGKASGDLCHPVLYCPEFHRAEFASKCADMKNSVASRSNAQVSCAAQFIGNHLGDYQDTGKWLHVDMASPASEGARGTGYGVALIVEMVKAEGW